MLKEAFRYTGDRIYIQSRHNADLFTVAHFRARTKITNTNILVRELLFADDNALIAHSADEIQRIVDAFANASSKFGLKINIKKTEVMFQPTSTMTVEKDINVDETPLNPVKNITYLGSIIASDGHIEAELKRECQRSVCHSGAFDKDSEITTMCQ